MGLLVVGCGGANGPKTLEDGETLRVIASTPHLASLAMAIAGEDAKVELLPGEGGNPHEYEPTISDRRRLQESHLLLVNGLALEPFDAVKLAESARVTLVDCSAGIPESWLLDGHEDEEGEEHAEEHAGHDHGHEHEGEHNPHVWLSTEGAIYQAEAITEAMAKMDSANADSYRKRLVEVKASLTGLRDEFKPRVAGLKKRRFVSNHDAFPYFAREFGLEQVGVVQRTPGATPTVQERREIELLLAEGGAEAIFMEPGFDDSASRAIAESSKLPLATLDPFGVGKPGPQALQDVFRKNLETVLKTLGE